MASYIKPETYHGTNKAGQSISETAKDAASDIDYKAIEAACDKILEVAKDELKKVSKAIGNVQLGANALCVEDKTLQPVVDEVSDFVNTLPEKGMVSFLDEIKSRSLQAHNELQTKYNDEAKEKLRQREASEG